MSKLSLFEKVFYGGMISTTIGITGYQIYSLYAETQKVFGKGNLRK
jgi:cell division protein FtsL